MEISFNLIFISSLKSEVNMAVLTLTLTHTAFWHGLWGIIIVFGFPDSSDSLVWRECSCMQTAKQILIASLNSFGSDI